MAADEIFTIKADRAAEAAAHLLDLKGGRMTRLELLKLLYLADRKALSSLRRPIVGGRYVSMDHGPVLSDVYDLIKGGGPAEDQASWSRFVVNDPQDANTCVLVQKPTLRKLSRRDLTILRETFAEFGHLSVARLWSYVHALPEYEDPQGSSKPIPHSALLRILGATDEEAEQIASEEQAQRRYDELLSGGRRA